MTPFNAGFKAGLTTVCCVLMPACSATVRPAEWNALLKMLQNTHALEQARQAAPKVFQQAQLHHERADKACEDGSQEECEHHSALAQDKYATALEMAGRSAAEKRRAAASERRQAALQDKAKTAKRLEDLSKRVEQLEKIRSLTRQLKGAQSSGRSQDLFEAADALRQRHVGLSVKRDERGVVITLFDLFGPRKSDVALIQTDVLDAIAKLAKQYGAYGLLIEGYTDSRGRRPNNLAISQARSQAVSTYLVREAGLGFDRVKSAGYGGQSPISDNAQAVGRAKNRRIEVVFVRRQGQN